ncbi:hypothetical protein ACFLXP_04530 [Chloroflexota bacterium]
MLNLNLKMATIKPPWKDRLILRIKKALGMNYFLCEKCRWNWRNACHNPTRPNATWCPEYKKRG